MTFVVAGDSIINALAIRYIDLSSEKRPFFNNTIETTAYYSVCNVYLMDGSTLKFSGQSNSDPDAQIYGRKVLNSVQG